MRIPIRTNSETGWPAMCRATAACEESAVEEHQHREHQQHAGDQSDRKIEQELGLPLLVAKVHLLHALRQVLHRRQLIDLGPHVAFDDARSQIGANRKATKLV